VALCLASALSFAVLPFLANAAYAAGVGLGELLLIRFVVAAIALWAIVAIRRPARPHPRIIAIGLTLGAVLYAAQSALYFAALPYNGPSLTTLLLYTFPVIVFVVLLTRGRERATPGRLLALILALAGVAVVLSGTSSGRLDPIGIALGLGTALAYATYILVGESVDATLDRILLGALVCTGAAVTYTVVTVGSGGPRLDFSPAGWWWAVALALISTAFALTTFFAGMHLIGAASASIISCVEPVATVLIGVSLFGDRLSGIQLLGAVAVVTAVVLLQRRPEPDPQPGLNTMSEPGGRLTDRLRLEPIGAQSAAELWRLQQDPGIAAWYAGRWSEAQAREHAMAMGEGWAREGVSKWLAYERANGELVGRGGLSRTCVDGRDCYEVGWAVREKFWGRGYATEIGRAGLSLAFDTLGAEEVVSFTEVHNTQSRAVMERLGMRYERDITLPGLVQGRAGIQDAAPFALYLLQDRPGQMGGQGKAGQSPEGSG